MRKYWVGIVLILVAAALIFWTNMTVLFTDVEVKGASEITEWVKLAIAIVSLLIGLVNLRIAMKKAE